MAFRKVAKVSEVPAGRVCYFKTGEQALALCNVDGTIYAIDDVCTHDGGSLDQGYLDGRQIECPRHGARFDVVSGRALTLPAVMPVRTFPVQVEGDEVLVDV